MLNLFITSLKSKEGKTLISAGLAATMQSLGYYTSYYKPVQTNCIEKNGFLQSKDLFFINNIDPYVSTHFTYMYKYNTYPIIASELENEIIDTNLIVREFKNINTLTECNIIEGCSGLLTPLNYEEQTYHLIKKIKTPVLFIVTPQEDSLNNILLNLNFAEEKNIKIRGIIINNSSKNNISTNALPRLIEEYSNAKILGIMPKIDNITPHDLIEKTLNCIDIEGVFDIKIEKLRLN